MSTETLLKQAVRGALALGTVGSMVGAGAALAQTAAPPASTSGGGTKLSQIIVTGSHIPRTSIATAQPVLTINRQQIDQSGFTTVGQVLQNMSQASPAINERVTNNIGQSAGAEFINLHNLGSQRLLVLVDGQRLIPQLGGQVDLSQIPASIVQRIEVLLDGSGAVYGSDAIAGVVNIITVKNYNGAEAHAYYGMYDAHGDGGGWDGKVQKYSFTVGTSGDRSSVLLSAGYRETQPIWASNRTVSKEPFLGLSGTPLAFFGSSRTPNGRFSLSGPTVPSSIASACSSSAGSYSCDLSGPLAGPNANPHQFTNADRYNYQPVNYVQNPEEEWDIFSQGHYDLTDNVTFTANATYVHHGATLVGAAPPIDFGAASTLHANGFGIGVAGNNQYNPFKVDLVPFAQSSATASNPSYVAWCRTYGSGPNGQCSPGADYLSDVGFRPTHYGQRVFKVRSDSFRFGGGFKGYFTLDNNQWQWNADYIFGDQTNNRVSDNLWNMNRAAQALGNANNCTNLTGCVPMNIFGGNAGFTKAMAKYVQYNAVRSTVSQIRDYNASLGGHFFNSWYAGPWGAAAGYEYYKTTGDFNPDPIVAAGNSSTNGSLPTNGKVSTNAQFVELRIPFGANVPGFEKFDADLAERWSQHKWGGTAFIQPAGGGPKQPSESSSSASDAAGHVGIKWQPINQLLIRASFTQGFRVPSVSELFQGGQDSYPYLTDPCATAGTLPPNCPAVTTQPDAQIKTTFGGNPNLKPETSTSRSIGAVWSPTFAPGLDLTVDYYKVEIVNYVAAVSPQTLLNDCAYNGTFCNKITRVNGVVTDIQAQTINQGSFHTNGWDVNLRYKLPTTPIGDFTVNLAMNFTKFFTTCNQGSCDNTAGFLSGYAGIPKHKYNLGVHWDYGPWAATWNVHLIGPMYEACLGPYWFGLSTKTVQSLGGPGCTYPNRTGPYGLQGQNEMGTTIYHDVQASYTVDAWNTTFSLGVRNLFNKEPPFNQTNFAPNYDYYNYRVPGRFFYGSVAVHF